MLRTPFFRSAATLFAAASLTALASCAPAPAPVVETPVVVAAPPPPPPAPLSVYSRVVEQAPPSRPI
jgi:hypothetical protein